MLFIADYSVRLILSQDRKKFVKENVLDLVAIIPFSSAFRIFRIAKLTKVLRIAKVAKLTKVAAYSGRFYKKAGSFFDTNGFKYVVFVTLVLVATGGVLIHYAEVMSIQDGVWWAFVTATTVGYGDISPSTGLGRLIATVLMIVGIGLLGSLTSTITSYFLNKKPKTVKTEMIEYVKGKIDNIDNLSSEDVDEICRILKDMNKKR